MAAGQPAAPPRVFLSHTGQQKPWLDAAYTLLTQLHRLDTFLDERSLPVGGDADVTMCQELDRADVVVLVLSEAFLSRRDPMNELVTVMARHKQQKAAAEAGVSSIDGSGSRQQILPVYFDISFSDCGKADDSYFLVRGFDATTAAAYAAALGDLRNIGGRRIDHVKASVDQGKPYEGPMAEQIVADTIALLKTAGKLPDDYNRTKTRQNSTTASSWPRSGAAGHDAAAG